MRERAAIAAPFRRRGNPYARLQLRGGYPFAELRVPLQQIVGRFLMATKEFPPSQTPGDFNLDNKQKQPQWAAGAR